ncbi:hypothetical protein V5799_009066 [Amblyomma americanum]|uniref:Uncharacterized protein n=1 Tax=Amblyomma americanum TaxID=6943 RepID=A0AAQ4FCS0_AMBAM
MAFALRVQYCLLVMKDHLVDAVEVHALLARHNLSAELFRSAERATVIEHLARLAEHGDLVPALRVRHAAAPHDVASSNTSDDGEECWLQPGSPFRLASLEPAIRTGQLATLLSKALHLTINAGDLELAAKLRGNRSADEHYAPAVEGEVVDVPSLLLDSPLWAAALGDSARFLEEKHNTCRVREQVHAVRHHLLAYVDHSSAPFEQKVNVTDALRNLSLAYTRARDPESSAVQLELHYGKDLLAATLGYWAARTILDAQRDVSPGWSLSTCLSVQAGGILSAQEKAGLFATALAFKVALDSAQELSGNRLATPRDRARMRLVFRAACGGLCELPSGRNLASKDAPTRRMQSKFSVVDGHRMCHAAVLNAPLFFLLFGCEPTSQMSQTGVCPLS